MTGTSGAKLSGARAYMLVEEADNKLQTLACDLSHPRIPRHRLRFSDPEPWVYNF